MSQLGDYTGPRPKRSCAPNVQDGIVLVETPVAPFANTPADVFPMQI